MSTQIERDERTRDEEEAESLTLAPYRRSLERSART